MWPAIVAGGVRAGLVLAGVLAVGFLLADRIVTPQQQAAADGLRLWPQERCEAGSRPHTAPQIERPAGFVVHWYTDGCHRVSAQYVRVATESLTRTRTLLLARGMPAGPYPTAIRFRYSPQLDGETRAIADGASAIQLSNRLTGRQLQTTAAHEWVHVSQEQWAVRLPEWAAEAQAVGVSLVVYPSDATTTGLLDLLVQTKGNPGWDTTGGYQRGVFVARLLSRHGMGLLTQWMAAEQDRCDRWRARHPQTACPDRVNESLDTALRTRETTLKHEAEEFAADVELTPAIQSLLAHALAAPGPPGGQAPVLVPLDPEP